MRWFLPFLILLLVACGGGDDDDDSNDANGESTQVAGGNPTAADAADDEEAEDSDSDDEDPNNPDVHVPLSPGSSGEVESDNPDPFATPEAELGTLKVTIDEILDPATTDSPIFQPEAGNKYWAVVATLEATSDKVVNTGIWTVLTSDGGEYETIYLTGVGEDIIYGALEAGATQQGVIVFEIPENVTVVSLKLDPHIYVGGNLFFDA
jgi:hypothetical protein